MSEDNKDNTDPETLKVENLAIEDKNAAAGDEQAATKTDKQKIDVLLKATGNAPIMKKKKWSVDNEKKIGSVVEFIKKYLRLEPSENLFLYVNQCFAPSPDQTIKNLYDCFGSDGKLVLHYCKTQAWG
ncbi:conserved hypothetical protein [Pediculus humanus corporis]|uniref:Ubiquitin-like protein ATG12 n=1 Tax=Pediculus humanus subsp. corporis TaxID=121224 RepID=E0VIX4_PEDHC|nr:uncharacterized protein Phum_PHUM235290 [Pediculus humanus corporis]EEB13330.1 conserved hypothetical protein [Pediculus humanus corporis]